MAVYVLHLDPPYVHAAHYIGWTPANGARRRVREHREGKGSGLIRAAVAAGCEIRLAHVFNKGGRDFERNLKKRRDVRRWCPLCAVLSRPLPHPGRMSARFRAGKPVFAAEGTE